jgi:erythronate-4-phosphate dehydrogenase
MKFIIDDKIPYLEGVLEPFAKVEYLSGYRIDKEAVRDADALLVRTRTHCDRALLEGSSVRFIATATIGFDHIDTAYCKANGIAWTNAPGCNSGSVMQYIASVLVTIGAENGFKLRNKTLGIVGVGNVGSKVEKLARILGMKVLLNDPPRERNEEHAGFVSLDEVLENSDIVTIHVPLNLEGPDKTFHLFGKEKLDRMKAGAWLINSSRGAVLETSSLKMALGYRLAGAVLDVWEHEPDIDLELLSRLFIGTPHIAGYSADGKANGTSISVQAFSHMFGFPLQDWYPQSVPAPENPGILLDASGKSSEELLAEAILHTYSVKADDARLRESPAAFENLRGRYPLRREFRAYTVQLKGDKSSVGELFKELGFSVTLL